ncbi:hypothetical protein PI125_g20674 [Phytophthora idaei]|nr:hypothetical protein PI125_g20674 [Phytophthora idaei]
MVHVPGSLGGSGFHRESVEDVQVKQKPRDEALSQIGSTTTPLNEARSADWQSPGRSSVNRKQEEDRDANRDLRSSGGKPQEFKASASEAAKPASKKKKSKLTRKKLEVPESDEEGVGSGKIASAWDENTLERAYYRKVKLTLVAGAFDANDLFDLALDDIRSVTFDLFHRRKILVGEKHPIADLELSPKADISAGP